MYEVFVWVPGKGWKLVKRSRSRDAALRVADSWQPLEVKLRTPEQSPHWGRTFYGGWCHTILEGTKYNVGIDVLLGKGKDEGDDCLNAEISETKEARSGHNHNS